MLVADVKELRQEMCNDRMFRNLCEKHGLPWDIQAGYEPRSYDGPEPEDLKLLVFMAEPGAIANRESEHLLPPVLHARLIGDYNTTYTEHYWRENLMVMCREIWPEDTEDHAFRNMGRSNSFWMSLPGRKQKEEVSHELLAYFEQEYLTRFVAMFPQALILAAGGKAQARLKRIGVDFIKSYAFTKPASNNTKKAIPSWRSASQQIAERIARTG